MKFEGSLRFRAKTLTLLCLVYRERVKIKITANKPKYGIFRCNAVIFNSRSLFMLRKIINVNIFVLEVLFLAEMIDLNERVIVPYPSGEARYFRD